MDVSFGEHMQGGEIFKPQGSLLDNAKSLPGKKESSMILLSESAAGDVEDEEFTLAGAERQQLVKFSAGKGPLDDNGFRIRPVANMVFNNLNCLPLGTAFTDENNGSPEQSDDSKPCVYPTGDMMLTSCLGKPFRFISICNKIMQQFRRIPRAFI